MARSYPIISADSHLQIAAERWTWRVPPKYRDCAPKTIQLPDGTDATVVLDGRPEMCTAGLSGLPYEKRTPNLGRFDSAPGRGSPQQRLQEQDIDGVDGEIMYASPAGADSYRRIKAKDVAAYAAVIHAYNEFLAEEYCTASPHRLMAMGMIPDSGIDDAVAELEYCAASGLKGVCLTRYPSGQEYPTPEDDRFWERALELNMPLTAHMYLAGAGADAGHPPFPLPWEQAGLPYDLRDVARGLDPFSKFTMYAVRGAGNAVQMIFDGLFERFPGLRFYFAETMVGWLPHFLETLDDQYQRHISWSSRYLGVRKLDRMPSEYVREHFYWGFMKNPVGVRMRHEIGVNRMMWANDFPHAESDWPESQQAIEVTFAGVPEDERAQMLSGNVCDFFHLDPEAYLSA
ncbi:MAG TPA: amidohydrolase family protein [Chloroflexota bacterium]|nr:amidohydrolase family protein [Chloroflexota bacterium]